MLLMGYNHTLPSAACQTDSSHSHVDSSSPMNQLRECQPYCWFAESRASGPYELRRSAVTFAVTPLQMCLYSSLRTSISLFYLSNTQVISYVTVSVDWL